MKFKIQFKLNRGKTSLERIKPKHSHRIKRRETGNKLKERVIIRRENNEQEFCFLQTDIEHREDKKKKSNILFRENNGKYKFLCEEQIKNQNTKTEVVKKMFIERQGKETH